MELTLAIFIYLISTVTLTILLVNHGIRMHSAVIVSLIFGQVLINILIPASNLNLVTGTTIKFDSYAALYVLIQLVTPIIVAIHSVYIGLNDRKNRLH